MGNSEHATARGVAGDIPRERFENAVEAAANAVCAHRSYRMVAAEVLAAVDYAGAVEAMEQAVAILGKYSDTGPEQIGRAMLTLQQAIDRFGEQ